MNLWAGATHWKFGQTKRPKATAVDKAADEGGEGGSESAGVGSGAALKKARKGSGPAVDFATLPDADDEALVEARVADALAAPKPAAARGKATKAAAAAVAAATQLSAAAVAKATAAADAGSFSLPADAGFSPRDLGRLFLRPNARATRRPAAGAAPGEGSFEAYDFCGPSAHPPHYGDDFGGDCGDDVSGFGGGDYDAANDDSFGDDDHGGAGFAMAGDDDFDTTRVLAPDRKVEKIVVRHATRSKKVDVKELKHQIWGDLSALKPQQATEAEAAAPAAPAVEQTSFSEVVESVESKCQESGQAQEGVTCSYYFICILHLANEHGLRLEGREDLSDFSITSEPGL